MTPLTQEDIDFLRSLDDTIKLALIKSITQLLFEDSMKEVEDE